MPSLLDNVLVIYKKSLYQIYFQERSQQMASGSNRFSEADIQRFADAHDTHNRTLETVDRELTCLGIRHRLVYRARIMNYQHYSLVISVGGDGTFIEAARRITDQAILGVNSDPQRSVGAFCVTNSTCFGDFMRNLTNGSPRIRLFNRMDIRLNDELYAFRAVNEVLVAHQSPAAMSRYSLHIDGQEEVQRSSGIWISTAAGSSGAIHSAGGQTMPLGSKRLQYRPRELFNAPNKPTYKLRGGMLRLNQEIELQSMMREGIAYIDGPHLRLPVPHGNRLRLSNSSMPLRVLIDKRATDKR